MALQAIENDIIQIAELTFGIKNIKSTDALDQDLHVAGDDVTMDFATEIAKTYGDAIYTIPYERFIYGEPTFGVGFLFIWRLISWPFRGHLFDPSPFERLELGHIAKVIEAGHWIEP